MISDLLGRENSFLAFPGNPPQPAGEDEALRGAKKVPRFVRNRLRNPIKLLRGANG